MNCEKRTNDNSENECANVEEERERNKEIPDASFIDVSKNLQKDGNKWHQKLKRKSREGGCGTKEYKKTKWRKASVSSLWKNILEREIFKRTCKTMWTKFQCNICDKEYSTQGNLSRHISVSHMGMKNKTCEECKRTFISRTDLEKHIRTHTGEKPYECDHFKKVQC